MLSAYRGSSTAVSPATSNKPILLALGEVTPPNPDGTAQSTNQFFIGSGAPDNGDGVNGDVYFRTDGTFAANNVIYHKEGGSWVAAVTT